MSNPLQGSTLAVAIPWEAVMPRHKSETLTLRTTAEIKDLLRQAAVGSPGRHNIRAAAEVRGLSVHSGAKIRCICVSVYAAWACESSERPVLSQNLTQEIRPPRRSWGARGS